MSQRFCFQMALVVSGLVGASRAAASPPSFMGLGRLPGHSESRALDISADGSTVVGFSRSSSSGAQEAFRWTAAGGMMGLGDLPGGTSSSWASGVSSDGSFVVGQGSSDLGGEAFVWHNGTMTALGDIPGGVFGSSAFDVSADGSVIVGRGDEIQSGGHGKAVLWQNGSPMDLGTQYFPGGNSLAEGVSADGTVVVGSGYGRGFRLRNGTLTSIQPLTGDSQTRARAVSTDGSFVVGNSGLSITSSQAFAWTDAGGIVGLGHAPTVPLSDAYAVSAGGMVIVGTDSRVSDAAGQIALIWDATHGMRRLQDVLQLDYGLDLTGWSLRNAYGISADGTTIVGEGGSPSGRQAWIAHIPEPSSLSLLLIGMLGALRRRRTVRGTPAADRT